MHTMTRGLPEVDDATRLQWAMVLGWKTWLYDEMAEPFRWSGSMHLFAISGLHVAMVAGLLFGSLRICQLPVWISGNITVLCMWGYIAISGWQTSAMRAGIMMSILIFGWMFRRPNSMLNSLFSAAWIILIGQPGQLFQTGFLLSFGVALSLVTLAGPLRQKLQEYTQPDPWIIRDQAFSVKENTEMGHTKTGIARCGLPGSMGGFAPHHLATISSGYSHWTPRQPAIDTDGRLRHQLCDGKFSVCDLGTGNYGTVQSLWLVLDEVHEILERMDGRLERVAFLCLTLTTSIPLDLFCDTDTDSSGDN